MKSPAQRLFEADRQSAEFRIGVLKEHWDVAAVDWPRVILWIRAAPREGAPARFHVALDLEGYRAEAPTGTFWNPKTEAMLDTEKRPKGKANSRFEMVFRTDWVDGKAFYHPYDRVAASSHSNWKTQQPHLVWTPDHTIVDYLEEIRSLLNSDDYVGV